MADANGRCLRPFNKKMFILGLFLFLLTPPVYCMRHHLELKLNQNLKGRVVQSIFESDSRIVVQLTSFGFIKGGELTVIVSELKTSPHDEIGFTLDKSTHSQQSDIIPNWESTNEDKCTLRRINESIAAVFFRINFVESKITIERKGVGMVNLSIGEAPADELNPSPANRRRRSSSRDRLSDSALFSSVNPRRKREATEPTKPVALDEAAVATVLPSNISSSITPTKAPVAFNGSLTFVPLRSSPGRDGEKLYKGGFKVKFERDEEAGFYTLAFHNCRLTKRNVTFEIIEINNKNFLSVGDMPLPIMYFVFCVVYLLTGAFWHWILYSSQEGVCKIHYLMLCLMYIKSVSLLFHGVNMHFMQEKGQKEEAFAILFYIVYLLKGIVMFLTIVLIGAGWTFVRHVLSDRDKKIFVIVIPLQILVNVASIFVDESEQGQQVYHIWKETFFFLDLVCCGAILFPIVGSIRHLQQASQTDGKVATNLEKLKIFRHFYILVVCFIYFTRIIVLLVSITVPFRYQWLDEFFVELATIAFFVLTGYKFRPASNNPYLQVSASDDEEDPQEVVTQSGALENVVRVNVKSLRTAEAIEMAEPLLKQRGESSHEYD